MAEARSRGHKKGWGMKTIRAGNILKLLKSFKTWMSLSISVGPTAYMLRKKKETTLVIGGLYAQILRKV